MATLAPSPEAIRVLVYEWIVARGMPPSCAQIGEALGISTREARTALAELRLGKTILVHPTTGEIWMAGPFSAAETPYKVSSKSVTWFANCAWDMLGIPFVAEEEVRIEAHCMDCGEPVTIETGPTTPPREQGFVHFLLPAARWYEDIGFT